MDTDETIITIHITGYGRCSLQENNVSLSTFLNVEKRIKIRIINRSLRPVLKVRVQLTDQSGLLYFKKTETKTYGMIRAKKKKISTFTILSNNIGIFTFTATIYSKDTHLFTFPISVRVMKLPPDLVGIDLIIDYSLSQSQ